MKYLITYGEGKTIVIEAETSTIARREAAKILVKKHNLDMAPTSYAHLIKCVKCSIIERE